MQKQIVDNMLQGMKGATFAGLDTVTVVKCKGGKKCPLGVVEKHTIGSRVMVFSKGGEDGGYARMVRRRLDEQPGTNGEAFDLSPRAWGTRVPQTPYVEHNGAHYLEVIFMKPGATHYTMDGVPVEKAAIQEWLPTEREPNDEAQGGLEDQVIIRTFKLDSIVGLRAMGQAA